MVKEKQCLIEINKMAQKTPLLKYLLSLDKTRISLKDLNGLYSPVILATQLEQLIDQELIAVDWDNKIIDLSELSFLNTFKKKKEIGDFKRETPEYMKTEKIEVNKPYLSIPKRK